MRVLIIPQPGRRIVVVRKVRRMAVGPRERAAKQMARHQPVAERTKLPHSAVLLKSKIAAIDVNPRD